MTARRPERVLVAVDFADASASAVALAGALAEAFDAHLTVLHAETLEMPPYFTNAQIETLEAERRDARAAAAEYVRTFAARYTAASVEPLVVDGPPAAAILRIAPQFDLVVLGTHGRRGASRWWLGSVSEAVIQEATTPVLVTREADEATRKAFADRRVAVAVAGEAGAESARWAGLLEEMCHATTVRVPDVGVCVPDQLRGADLVLVGLDRVAAGRLSAAAARVLQECAHPVLFVPEDVRAPERRSP